MIDSIVFDLSEVLLNGFVGFEQRLSTNLNLNTLDKSNSLYDDVFFELMRGEISENIFWSKVIKKNHWPTSVNTLKKQVRNNFAEIPGTREVISSLQGKYKLGLLSNHSAEWISYCQSKFNFEPLFNHCTYSFSEGICKPNTLIFNKVLKRLGSDAKNCIFIDDSLENIDAAKMLGFQAIQFSTAQNLKNELDSLLSNH